MTHTREEILSMTDEELREAIRRAQGWHELPPPASPKWQRPTEHGVEHLYCVPNYPHDIAAAFELVEDFQNEWQFTRVMTTSEDDKRVFRFYDVGVFDTQGDYISHSFGHTPAQAISRAWLIWHEGAR